MGYFSAAGKSCRSQYSLRYRSAYFCLIVAFVLLGSTNATNTSTSSPTSSQPGLTEKIKTWVTGLWKDSNDQSTDNSTTANQSVAQNGTSGLAHGSDGLSHVRWFFSAFLQLLAQLFMIFGGILPYIPQYSIIKRSQNAEGFSNYVCLTLLAANIIRIEFWFGKHFETPLLMQSIVMIICMLIMLELWTRVHAKTMQQLLVPTDQEPISTSKEQLTEEFVHVRFTDFKVTHFWRWTTFASYIQFLVLFTCLLSIVTWLFIRNVVYIETIGFLAVLVEALLGIPQFLRNLRLKSTEGMSVKMVLLWASGDIFKTVYFIVRSAPKQFLVCGVIQISIDIAILVQVIAYSSKYQFRQQ